MSTTPIHLFKTLIDDNDIEGYHALRCALMNHTPMIEREGIMQEAMKLHDEFTLTSGKVCAARFKFEAVNDTRMRLHICSRPQSTEPTTFLDVNIVIKEKNFPVLEIATLEWDLVEKRSYTHLDTEDLEAVLLTFKRMISPARFRLIKAHLENIYLLRREERGQMVFEVHTLDTAVRIVALLDGQPFSDYTQSVVNPTIDRPRG